MAFQRPSLAFNFIGTYYNSIILLYLVQSIRCQASTKSQIDYTLEEIYQLVGKEDKTAGLTFKFGSESFNKYGQFITVVFIYTQKEREKMDKLIQNKVWTTHGNVSAKYFGLELPDDKITLLKDEGVNSKDILEISYFRAPSKNRFHSIEKREINKIKFLMDSWPKGRDYDWMYGFSKKQEREDIGLSPWEIAFYLAGKLYYESDKLTENEKHEIYQDNGDLDVKVEWEYLRIKYLREDISKKEKRRVAELYGIKKKESFEILDKYLQQAGSSLKKMAKENLEQAAELLLKVMDFKERRFTVKSRHPIYLDLDGYMHIYMRHVEEFKVTKHFEDKDNFQWNQNDVFTVMEHVLKEIEGEYEVFRENNPDKRYSRYGEYSMYFEGDYYTFHIEPCGRISTFHKNRKEHEKGKKPDRLIT